MVNQEMSQISFTKLIPENEAARKENFMILDPLLVDGITHKILTMKFPHSVTLQRTMNSG
jgi:hypothetical protein